MDTALNFSFFDDPLLLYNAMWEDIKNAKKYVYIETYKFGNDPIGERFRDILIKKAKEGIEIKILVDSWGATVNKEFFKEMIQYGAQVVFFQKIKIHLDLFSKNHLRNHRKLFIVDDNTVYVGSANISNHSLNWRESVLRLEHPIALKFKNIFFEHFNFSEKLFPNKKRLTRPLYFQGFEIIRDIPGNIFQPTKKKFLQLIKKAKTEIIIETPYFLPGKDIRKSIIDAAHRGVSVHIITPQHSDVGLFDILRNKYLGKLIEENINIHYYRPHNLHAKLLIVDRETFVMGSSNFDYRSFRFMHEINLVGNNQQIIQVLLNHIETSKADCIPFNYELWLKRPKTLKIIECMLVPIRHLF